MLDQSKGDPDEWGGGFEGYGRRVASRIGSNIVQSTFQASTAAVLKQDVRYIQSGQSGFKHRVGHAILYSFITLNSSGHRTLNIPNLGGYYVASAASTLWLPGNHNPALYDFEDSAQQAGLGVLVNLLQEFWPDISHRVFHRR